MKLDELKRLHDRIDREVEQRDRKITSIYQNIQEHYTALDQKIDKLRDEIIKGPGSRKSGVDDWKLVSVVVALLVMAFGLLENQILTDAKIAEKGFNILSERQDLRLREMRDEVVRLRDWQANVSYEIPSLRTKVELMYSQHKGGTTDARLP